MNNHTTHKRIVFIVCLVVALFATTLVGCNVKSDTFTSFVVSFDADNVVDVPSVNSSTSDGKVSKPNINADGYNLIGFYENREYTIEFDFDKVIRQDTVVYVRIERAKNLLAFRGNGSTSGSMDAIKVEAYTSVTLPLSSYARIGYTFVGWGHTATDSVKNSDGGLYYVDSRDNQELYAKWQANVYTTTLDNQGGDGVLYAEVVFDTIPDKIQIPRRDGYSFVGYYTLPNGQGVQYFNSLGVGSKNWDISDNDSILYAQWVSTQNIVAFDGNGHNSGEMSSIIVTTGDIIVLPDSGYAKTGYTFAGWIYSANDVPIILLAGDEFVIPATDEAIIFIANWIANAYMVLYYNNSTQSLQQTQRLEYDKYDNLLGSFDAVAGYTLLGWNTLSNGQGKHYDKNERVKNLTSVNNGYVELYAELINNSYRVALDLQGGSNGTLSAVANFDEFLPTVIGPSKAGYNFDGYYAQPQGQGNKYYDGSMIGLKRWDIASDTTLYAHYTPRHNTVVFDANGGVGVGTTIDTETDQTIVLLGYIFARVGYDFDGWDTLQSGHGDRYLAYGTFIVPPSDNAIVLYAIWTPKNINIVFDGNKHTSGEMLNISVFVLDIITLPSNGYLRRGYEFVGYSLMVSGSDVLLPQDKFEIYPTDNNITFYVIWQIINYNVIYNLDGGDNSQSNPYTYTVQDGSLQLRAASKRGYDFLYWADINNQIVDMIPSGSTGDILLTAHYAIIYYNITYNLNGGQNHATNPLVYTVIDADIRIQAPIKLGATFLGWSGSSSGGYIYSGSVGDIGFTAEWDGINYTITYELDGGDNDPSNPNIYTYDSDPIVLKAPTRLGYNFVGWFERFGDGTEFENNIIPKNSDTNKYFVARWDIIYYTITYDNLNGADNSANPTSYTVEYAVNLDDLYLDGYAFMGWSDNGFIAEGSTGDRLFSAIWEEEVYSLYFFENRFDIAGDEGTNRIAVVEYTGSQFGTYIDIPTYFMTGYIFWGWYDLLDLTLTLVNDKIYIPEDGLGDASYYAALEIIEYKINYVLAPDGEDASSVSNLGNIKTYTIEYANRVITFLPPTRIGYQFMGWYLDKNYTQEVYRVSVWIASDITLYALWQEDVPEPPTPTVATTIHSMPTRQYSSNNTTMSILAKLIIDKKVRF